MELSIQKIVIRAVAVTALLLGTGLLISSLVSPDGTVVRGNVPTCQNACLADHGKRMETLVSQYEATHDRIYFQDRVEQAVAQYRHCSDNCRVVYSLK